jgi:hypothetical protein
MSLINNVLQLWRPGQYILPADAGPRWEHVFAAGQPGLCYRPAVLSSLFQDAALEQPVTAMEQFVHTMLDLSGNGVHAAQATLPKRTRVSRRVNLLVGSDMTGGAGGTPGTPPDGWFIHVMSGTYSHTVDGGLHRFAASAGRSTIRAPVTWAPNTTYRFTVKVTNYGGTVHVDTVAYLGLRISTTGYTQSTKVDGVAASEIGPGVHTITIDASCAGGSPLSFVYLGVGAGGPGSGDFSFEQASLTLACDAHLPHQRVDPFGIYDDSPEKFPTYLKPDAVDDAMQSVVPLDLTAVDKLLVCAGVTKLGDAAVGVVCELGNSLPVGAVYLAAPNSAGPSVGFASRGSASAVVVSDSGHAAPAHRVLTGLGDIGADGCTLRVNGVPTTSAADQGTGNYGAHTVNLFARNASSLYSNVRFYGLTLRGGAYTEQDVAALEHLTAQDMRMPL